MWKKFIFLFVVFVLYTDVAYSYNKEEIYFYNNIVDYIYDINENLHDKEFCNEQYKEMREYFIEYMSHASYSKEQKNYISELLNKVKTGIKEENIFYLNEALSILQLGLKICSSDIYIK